MTAGINACDAISGALLGQRAGGEHADTVEFLKAGGEDGRAAARQLVQLLRYKTPAQYDPRPTGRLDARKALDLAERLVERARRVVRPAT